MGDVADMMLDGTLCQECGVFVNEVPLGYPISCRGCKIDAKKLNTGKRKSSNGAKKQHVDPEFQGSKNDEKM